MQKIKETASYISEAVLEKPEIAIVLGSGLGSLVSSMIDKKELSYENIPNFPRTTVKGHDGKLIFGKLGGKKVLAMLGRFHYYEGYNICDVIFPIRVFKSMGVGNIIITNAAGGVNESFKPGDLMLISDHISFFSESPLRGANMDELGTRFPDMSQAYDRQLINMAKEASNDINLDIKTGIYAYTKGPMYETPAEIRALRVLGADAVGMSTVPEVIAAKHAGMSVLGISCITNMASGILEKPLSHEEVMIVAKEVEGKFSMLVEKIIERMCII